MGALLVSIEQFVDKILKIRRRLARRSQPTSSRGWPDGFPSAESINALLHACYFASLEQYEGRTLRTVLNWTHPAIGRLYVHRFAEPSSDFSAHNMRQLAQVADGVSSTLSVVFADDKLALSGIEFCWPVGGALLNNGFVPGVRISIKGPGHIEYQEGTLAVAYKRGRKVRLRPLQDCCAIRSWITDAELALREEAIATLENDPFWGRHEERSDVPNGIILTLLCSALRAIENSGHGGTILVLPNAEYAESIDIRFPASSSGMKNLVRRFGEASLLAATLGLTANSPFGPSMVDVGNLMSTFEAYGVALAKLADCDGAIVMTRDAELLGFGGIIQSPAPYLPGRRRNQTRGARHTSAKWLCDSVPGSIAIVVSADRGITVLHSTGNNTETLTDFVVW